jgi:phosphoserine phosphatase
MRVDPLRKELALAELCGDLGVQTQLCVTVGDSEMDRSFLRAGGLGVLLGDAAQGDAMGVASVPALLELLDVLDEGSPSGGALRGPPAGGSRR